MYFNIMLQLVKHKIFITLSFSITFYITKNKIIIKTNTFLYLLNNN